MISSMSVPICNHLHVRRANNGRIMSFKGVPFFFPSFMGTLLTQWHELLSRNTRDSRLSYIKNSKSLSHLVLERYRDVTPRHQDRHQDRITIANTLYAMLALVHKNLLCINVIKDKVEKKCSTVT